MVVTIVHVHVKAEYLSDFIHASRINHEASVQEEGNLRFDILQRRDDPHRFILYEAYVDSDAAAAHKKTDHYLTWRDGVENYMASPREGIQYEGLYPEID